MEDIGCPRCKTTKYRKASLKLMVNTCGHALCDTCVELLFAKGSAPCPECGIPLRRSGFRVQLFENPLVEKYVDIKKRVLRDFSKVEADFQSLREYNDYLEMVETIVFNLAHNIDVLETNKRIEEYKKENIEQITRARSRLNPELLELDAILEEEQLIAKTRELEDKSLFAEEKKLKTKTKESLIDELMFSDTDAEAILQSHKKLIEKQEEARAKEREEYNTKRNHILAAASERIEKIKKNQVDSKTQFSSGIMAGSGFLPIPKPADDPLYFYEDLRYDNPRGPDIPTVDEIRSFPTFGRTIKPAKASEISGGYHPCFQLGRELLEAYSDLYFVAKKDAGIKTFGNLEPEVMDMETN